MPVALLAGIIYFSLVFVVGFALGGSFYAFLFIGTLYMQQVLGFSALQGLPQGGYRIPPLGGQKQP